LSQKTLDGKTECRKTKNTGSCIVRYSGNNKMIEAGLKEVHEKHPCIKMTVNGESLKETPKEWDGEK
jgi:hypothetical protein